MSQADAGPRYSRSYWLGKLIGKRLIQAAGRALRLNSRCTLHSSHLQDLNEQPQWVDFPHPGEGNIRPEAIRCVSKTKLCY